MDLRYFLPDEPSIDVVITTQNATVKRMSRLGGVEVAEMTAEESITLFLRQAELETATSEQWIEAALIVEELGWLALAVTLAGSYVAATPRLHADIKHYLPEYQQRRQQLLKRKTRTTGAPVWCERTDYMGNFIRGDRTAGHPHGSISILLGWLHWDDIFLRLFEGLKEPDEPEDTEEGRQTWSSVLFSADDTDIDIYQIEEFVATSAKAQQPLIERPYKRKCF